MIIIIDVLNISYLTVFLKYDLKYELAVFVINLVDFSQHVSFPLP